MHTHTYVPAHRVSTFNLKILMWSYINVKIEKTISDEDDCISSNLNPVLEMMFEHPPSLPIDHTLTISLSIGDRCWWAEDWPGKLFPQPASGLPRTFLPSEWLRINIASVSSSLIPLLSPPFLRALICRCWSIIEVGGLWLDVIVGYWDVQDIVWLCLVC